MNHGLLGALLLAPSMLLSGCVIALGDHDPDDAHSDHQKVELRNRQAIADLPLGSSLAQVQARLGEPDFTDALRGRSGELRVLRYRTHRSHSDGDTTRDETTPLVFVDGKLAGIGEAAYAQLVAP